MILEVNSLAFQDRARDMCVKRFGISSFGFFPAAAGSKVIDAPKKFVFKSMKKFIEIVFKGEGNFLAAPNVHFMHSFQF